MARGRDGGTGSEHLSDDLLRSLARQELSVETAVGPLRHLVGCAGCRRRLADISPQAAELVEELWGSPENAGWMAEPSKAEVLTAAAQSLPLFDELRTERLERLPLLFNLRRLQSPFIALRLLQEARAAWQDDPIRARYLSTARISSYDMPEAR